jgi:hypothetical protein
VTTSPPPTRRSWRRGVHALWDRLPTSWLITGITGLLLATSAAFGGLADAAEPAAPRIETGMAHAGSELTVTVNGALLIDAFPEQYLIPTGGYRLLVVRALVENTTTEPRRLTTAAADSLTKAGADTVRLVGVPGIEPATKPVGILVIDDGSDTVSVQPGVPVELAFVWEVAGAAVAKGDRVEVQLMDRVYIGEGELTYGGLYGDPVVGATLDVPLGDVGAGVSE